MEPRVLRSGKIVGEDVVQEDAEESDATETGSEIDVDQESDGGEAIEVEEGLDEDEDEVMEDVDWPRIPGIEADENVDRVEVSVVRRFRSF